MLCLRGYDVANHLTKGHSKCECRDRSLLDQRRCRCSPITSPICPPARRRAGMKAPSLDATTRASRIGCQPQPESSCSAIADDLFDEKNRAMALHLRCEDLREAMGGVSARIQQLEDPRWAGQGAAEIKAKRAEHEELKAEFNRMYERRQEADRRAGIRTAIIASCREMVRRVDKVNAITAYAGAIPAMRKGEAAVDAVETRRRRLRELDAEANQIAAAPYPSSHAKQRASERIAAMAKAGAPDAFMAVEQDQNVIWPTMNIVLPSGEQTQIPDVMAILAHIHGPALLAAEEKAIDQQADDAAALTDAQRASSKSRITRDRLGTEREEVTFLRLANSTGNHLEYRADTDPRALLGLSDDMPAPREGI